MSAIELVNAAIGGSVRRLEMWTSGFDGKRKPGESVRSPTVSSGISSRLAGLHPVMLSPIFLKSSGCWLDSAQSEKHSSSVHRRKDSRSDSVASDVSCVFDSDSPSSLTMGAGADAVAGATSSDFALSSSF